MYSGLFRNVLALVCSLAAAASPCCAQWEVSSGFDVSYPILENHFNSQVSYGQVSFGLKVGIAYKPAETQFFPILNVSLGRTRLPLQQFNANVVALNFNYINVMLNENYVLRFPQSEVYLYGGIGFTDLSRKGVTVAGSGGGAMQATIDSVANITHIFPAVNLGVEYNYGQSAGKDLYLTMGLNFQYILLLSNENNYYLHVTEGYTYYGPYAPSLSGNIITPSFYIALHYLLHKGGKGKMYL